MSVFSNKISKKNIDESLLIAVSTSVFLPIKISSVIIILAVINFLIDKNIVSKIRQLFTNKLSLWMIGFFALQIVSAFLSQNLHEGFSIVERRLTFLLFPILLIGQTSHVTLKKVCISFAIASQVALIFCLVVAFNGYIKSNDSSVFFYHNLSSIVGLNAIYFSVYCAFSLFVLLYYFYQFNQKQKYFSIASLVFLLMSLVLLSSKNLIFITIIGAILFLIKESKFAYKKWIILSSVLIFLASIALIKPVKDRFLVEINANTEVVSLTNYRYDTPFTGLTLRLVIWKICIEIINEKKAWIAGVGVGDFQDLINQKYIEKGIYAGNKQLGDTGYIGYGPHNQWMEMLLSTGIIGLVYFIFFIGLSINYFIKNKLILAFLFMLVFVSVSMTECVLSTNKGIIFFAFFMVLFNNNKLVNEQNI